MLLKLFIDYSDRLEVDNIETSGNLESVPLRARKSFNLYLGGVEMGSMYVQYVQGI